MQSFILKLIKRFSRISNYPRRSNHAEFSINEKIPCLCKQSMMTPLVQSERETTRKFKKIQFKLYVCDCNHICFYPIPSEKDLKEYYSNEWGKSENFNVDISYKQWDKDNGDRHQKSFICEIQRLSQQFFGKTHDIKIHDIGCGYGGLVFNLNRLGFDATGRDIDEASILAGKGKGNDKIHYLDVENLHGTKFGEFDVICSYHTMEHYANPLKIFEEIRVTLKKEGFLIFRVPNGDYLPARKDYFSDFNCCFFPGHLHYFTPTSSLKLLSMCGFRVVELSSTNISNNGQDEWFYETLLGVKPERIRDKTALLNAVAKNNMTWELQVVAVRSDSYC